MYSLRKLGNGPLFIQSEYKESISLSNRLRICIRLFYTWKRKPYVESRVLDECVVFKTYDWFVINGGIYMILHEMHLDECKSALNYRMLRNNAL